MLHPRSPPARQPMFSLAASVLVTADSATDTETTWNEATMSPLQNNPGGDHESIDDGYRVEHDRARRRPRRAAGRVQTNRQPADEAVRTWARGRDGGRGVPARRHGWPTYTPWRRDWL